MGFYVKRVEMGFSVNKRVWRWVSLLTRECGDGFLC